MKQVDFYDEKGQIVPMKKVPFWVDKKFNNVDEKKTILSMKKV
jgi:hypothetical protein